MRTSLNRLACPRSGARSFARSFRAAPRLGLPRFSPASLALVTLGSLLPDVDHPSSWVGRRLRFVSYPLARVFGHRGFTHSLVAVALCGTALASQGAGRAAVAPVVVGYLAHLAADLLTPRGLRLAWPLRRSFALPVCRTGSAGEALLVAGLLAWSVVELAGLRPR